LAELESTDPELRLRLREPCRADAAEIWSLVAGRDELDVNSPYAYLLMCTDFSETGLVARRIEDDPRTEGELVGFVLGYRPPKTPEALFVWQIAVAPSLRGEGMGSRMLSVLFDRCQANLSVDHLEATVTPSNLASRTLFTRFARERSAPIEETVAFRSSDFPVSPEPSSPESHPGPGSDSNPGSPGPTAIRSEGEPHEDEIRLRIGPVGRSVG